VSIESIHQHIWKDKKEQGNLYLTLRTTGKSEEKHGKTRPISTYKKRGL
jgi:hypothetical protein